MFGKKKNTAPICDERLSHIAFIMDGNGRWATSKGLPRSSGHAAGAKAFKNIVECCSRIGLRHMTVYAFSTENWSRPKEEVDRIMKLLSDYLDEAERMLDKYDLRIVFLGDKAPFERGLRKRMLEIEEKSSKGKKILNRAMNYGSKSEIVHAVNSALAEGKKTITEEDIDKNLYTKLSPPPDLIIRSAGEMRLSNFLLWQAAYSEFYFTDTLWPDFDEKELYKAIECFYKRKRRYGGLG